MEMSMISMDIKPTILLNSSIQNKSETFKHQRFMITEFFYVLSFNSFLLGKNQ